MKKFYTFINIFVLVGLIYQPLLTLSAQELMLPAPDISAPKIDFEPISEQQPMGQAMDFSVGATDDSGIRSVTLFYRQIGTDKFKQLAMFEKVKKNTYSAIIPAEDMNAPGIEYYIQAIDVAGNTILRGYDFSPLVILVSSPGLEEAVSVVSSPVAGQESLRKEAGSNTMRWVLIGLGVAAVAGLGLALGGGGGGGGGGSGDTGSINISADVPE